MKNEKMKENPTGTPLAAQKNVIIEQEYEYKFKEECLPT